MCDRENEGHAHVKYYQEHSNNSGIKVQDPLQKYLELSVEFSEIFWLY